MTTIIEIHNIIAEDREYQSPEPLCITIHKSKNKILFKINNRLIESTDEQVKELLSAITNIS